MDIPVWLTDYWHSSQIGYGNTLKLTTVILEKKIMTSRNGNAFRVTGPLCGGKPPVTSGFPSQRPVTRALMFSLMLALKNCWLNRRVTGDLGRYDTHCDVIVMLMGRQAVKLHSISTLRILTFDETVHKYTEIALIERHRHGCIWGHVLTGLTHVSANV